MLLLILSGVAPPAPQPAPPPVPPPVPPPPAPAPVPVQEPTPPPAPPPVVDPPPPPATTLSPPLHQGAGELEPAHLPGLHAHDAHDHAVVSTPASALAIHVHPTTITTPHLHQ